jgi:hypothetical protein
MLISCTDSSSLGVTMVKKIKKNFFDEYLVEKFLNLLYNEPMKNGRGCKKLTGGKNEVSRDR